LFSRLFFILALGLSLAAWSSVGLAEDLGQRMISEIQVDGNRTIAGADIISWLKIKRGDKPAEVRTLFDQDLKALWKTGKFEDVQLSMVPLSDDTLRLLIQVEEKPLLSTVAVRGQQAFPDKQLLQESGLAAGSPYDLFLADKAAEKIANFYREKEYYQVEVGTETIPADGQVALTFIVNEGLKVKVTQILVTGNQAFAAGDIKGVMETKEAGWFVGGVYKEETFIIDLKKILLRYAKEGYLKAKLLGYGIEDIDLHRPEIVAEALAVNADTKEMTISLRVEEGIQYKIRNLTVSGNIIFSQEELLGRMALRPGAVMDRLVFEQDMQMVRMAYAEKGYIFSDITPEMEYSDDAGAVDVSIIVREGSIARVERVDIRGNSTTKDKVIRRELMVEPGEPFDSRSIQRSRENISNLGFFQDVKVTTEPGSSPAEQVLVFEVVERQTGTISLGAGYSSVDYLMGYLQLTQANLFGNGQSVSLQWELGSLRQSWQMSFTEPWLFDAPVSFGVDVWNISKRRGYSGQLYNLLSQGGDIRLGRRFDDYWKGYLTYKLESDEYTDLDTSVLRSYPEGRNDISSITPAVIFDSRDNIFDPTTGTYHRFSLEVAGGPLGGDNNFFKYLYDGSYYMPLIWQFVLALHGEAGNEYGYDFGVTGLTDVPPAERFRLGGTDSVRGYGEGVFGQNFIGGGGRFKLCTNIELHYPIIGPLKGVAFLDAGNVWERMSDFTRNPHVYKGTGVGFRLTVPGTVILIRFDFGYPLDRDPTGRPPGLNYHFNIGNIF
jgi:outer membrane protein insertion porin family